MGLRHTARLNHGDARGPDPTSPDPAPFPASAADWSLYSGLGTDIQYYGSTPDRGHEWMGQFQFSLLVSVPAGVVPGWYDIEVSSAGWDYGQSLSFDDEEHFYLYVVPEPAASWLLVAGVLLLGDNRRCTFARAIRQVGPRRMAFLSSQPVLWTRVVYAAKHLRMMGL